MTTKALSHIISTAKKLNLPSLNATR